jgi:pantoate--beta-alanine ligase
MFVIKSMAELRQHLLLLNSDTKIGFVPTMGALHHGHVSLINQSKHKGCYTICSIFVNPTQFNNSADLDKYPSSIESDIKMLAEAGCDVLLLPSVEEMYGNTVQAAVYDYGTITSLYEGEKRPGHFDGVITIVSKFFSGVKPDEVFFGQKDLQQCMVIKELIRREFPAITFNMGPIIREESGLAASSRNRRLSDADRQKAAFVSKALYAAKQKIQNGTPVADVIEEATQTYLTPHGFEVEYFDLIEASSMKQIERPMELGNSALVIACWCSDVRLIDNMLLTE